MHSRMYARTAQGLTERHEAAKIADREFERVKQEKLAAEHIKAKRLSGDSAEANGSLASKSKVKLREMSNRASAAASRARMVVYCKDLEVRVDRLEDERNSISLRAERAIRKSKRLEGENVKIKKILRSLYELKVEKVTDVLVKTDALLLLNPANEETDDENQAD